MNASPDTSLPIVEPPRVIPIRRFDKLVGFLTSMGVHLSLMIVLTILWIVPPAVNPLELQFSVASGSDAPLESFELDAIEIEIPVAATETSDLLERPDVGVPIVEPALEEFGKRTGVQQGNGGESGEGSAVPAPAPAETRKGSFFGTHAYGDEFVFVVDASRSMLSPCGFRYGRTRFEVASQELLRSIDGLGEDQKFCVFFFGLRTRVMFDRRPKLIKATDANRKRLKQWMYTLSPGEGTDPRIGVWQALKLKPAAIFLLSDGEFNGRRNNPNQIPGNPTVERIILRYLNQQTPIHTIAFEDILNRRRMRNIATLTAGTHKFIGSQSYPKLLVADLESSHDADIQYALQSIIDEPDQLAHDRFIQPTVHRLTQLIRSRNAKYRESSHYAMLALADSLELDISEVSEVEELNTVATSQFAHDAWVSIWKAYFLVRSGETRLTRVVRP